VFIEGQLILDDGKFTCVDETALVHRAQAKAQALYKAAYAG
jgi:hypothetical protein